LFVFPLPSVIYYLFLFGPRPCHRMSVFFFSKPFLVTFVWVVASAVQLPFFLYCPVLPVSHPSVFCGSHHVGIIQTIFLYSVVLFHPPDFFSVFPTFFPLYFKTRPSPFPLPFSPPFFFPFPFPFCGGSILRPTMVTPLFACCLSRPRTYIEPTVPPSVF